MKTFAFTFAIGAIMTSGFARGFATANKTLVNLNKRIRDLKQQQKELDSTFKKGAISADDYNASMDRLNASMSRLQKQRGATESLVSAQSQFGSAIGAFSKVGMAVYAASRPVLGMVGIAGDFEQGMSKVAAITGASSSEMARLTTTARELGEQTKFTARESAEAMSYLGMAGWKTKQIIAGMPGLLNLAAAGGTDLARTADIVSDNLTAFGLAADQSAHMADVYATVVTNTNTNVELLGETMKYAAPVAKAFGASMEETAAMAGLMANAGIKGSQAGTSLRAGLMRLAGPPKMAANALAELGLSMTDITQEQKEATMAMQSLGISMNDTSGPRKMSAILKELREKMSGLSQEQQLAYAKSIFGQQAAAGWLAVLNSGDEAFDGLITKLENSNGAADKMAKTMQNNLNGAMTRLSSATESIAISFGQALLPGLTKIADGAAWAASGISKFTAEHPKLVQWLATTGTAIAGVALAVTGWGVISSLASLATAAFGVGLAGLLGPVGLVGAAIVGVIAVGTALYLNWDTITTRLSSAWENIRTGVTGLGTAIGTAVSNGAEYARNALMNLPRAALYATAYTIGLFFSWPFKVANAMLGLIPVGQQFIANVTQWGGEAVAGAMSFFSNLPNLLYNVILEADSAGQQFISEASSWGSAALDAIMDWLGALPSRLSEMASNAWAAAKNAFGSFAAGVSDATEGTPVAHNANGGIYRRGAFLTTFAENSGESAIPHTPTARNIGLLARTNEIMGRPLSGGNINASFAPVINVTGGNTTDVDAILTQKMKEFRVMLAELQHQERRVAYA